MYKLFIFRRHLHLIFATLKKLKTVTKGQIISKGNFGVYNSSKKPGRISFKNVIMNL